MGVGSRSKAWRFTDINKDYSVGGPFYLILCALLRSLRYQVLFDVPCKVSCSYTNKRYHSSIRFEIPE